MSSVSYFYNAPLRKYHDEIECCLATHGWKKDADRFYLRTCSTKCHGHDIGPASHFIITSFLSFWGYKVWELVSFPKIGKQCGNTLPSSHLSFDQSLLNRRGRRNNLWRRLEFHFQFGKLGKRCGFVRWRCFKHITSPRILFSQVYRSENSIWHWAVNEMNSTTRTMNSTF